MAKFAKFDNTALLEGLKQFGNKKGSIMELTRFIRANVVGFDKEDIAVIKSRVNSRLNSKKNKVKTLLAKENLPAEMKAKAEKALNMLSVKVGKKGRQPENLSVLIGALQNIQADETDETDESVELDESDADETEMDESAELDETDDTDDADDTNETDDSEE